MVMAVNGSSVFVILYSSFIPCRESADGNRQEANTLVEERGERLKLLGDRFGPTTVKKTTVFEINHLRGLQNIVKKVNIEN